MIELRGVTKRFGTHLVLDRLDLRLGTGRVTALMGPNGAGKTTVGRLLLGLARPDYGAVTGLGGLRRAAVFQDDRLCGQLDAVRNVRLVLDRGVPRAAVVDALRAVGLDDDALAVPVRDLSGGQRRKVAVVRALLADADLVVLDEPFTGLDAVSRDRVLRWVAGAREDRTVLLITHDVADARWFGADLVRLGVAGTVAG